MGKHYKDKISKNAINARYMSLAKEFMTNKMGEHSDDMAHQETHKLAGYFQQIFEEGKEQKHKEVRERILDTLGL